MIMTEINESLDAIDIRLLQQLQQDASLTNQALAEFCHLTPPTCLRRVRRLHTLGLIASTVAVLQPDVLKQYTGQGLVAIVEVTLDQQAQELLDAFEAQVVADDAVQQCYRTSSGPDFVVILALRDMDDFLAASQRLFTQHANVRNVRTFFSVKRAKFGVGVPLGLSS